jgi:hypothetical protein
MASITAPARTAFDSKSPLLLPVPYFSQRDSATGQGDRMCFSSTCAMAAEFCKPGCLAGAGQPDDRYMALVQPRQVRSYRRSWLVDTLQRLRSQLGGS